MPAGWDMRASLDSAAPMNPTGTPMIAAGRGAPESISSSRWNRAVGALPIAMTAPAKRSVHSDTAAAERVVPHAVASWGTRGSLSRHSTSLSAGSRERVTPDATMRASVRMGAPPRSASRAAGTRLGWMTRSRARSVWPQAWIMRTAIFSASVGSPDRSASARMVAKECA